MQILQCTLSRSLGERGKVSPPDSYQCILRAVKITKWTYFFYLNVLPRTVVKTSVKSEVLLKTCKSCLITEKESTALKMHSNTAEYLTAICTLWIYCYCWEQHPSLLHIRYLTQNKHFKTQKERQSTSKKTSGTISKWQVKNMTVWQEATPDLTSRKPFPSRGDKLHVREHTMAADAAHLHTVP